MKTRLGLEVVCTEELYEWGWKGQRKPPREYKKKKGMKFQAEDSHGVFILGGEGHGRNGENGVLQGKSEVQRTSSGKANKHKIKQ